MKNASTGGDEPGKLWSLMPRPGTCLEIRLGTRDEGGGSGEAVGDECEQERGREGGEKCEHKNMEHLRVPLTREGSARRHTASLGSQDLNTGPSDSRATYHHLDSPTIYFCSQATQPSNYRHNFLTST